MFSSTDFQVDEESETYRMLHPNAGLKKRKRADDVDSDGDPDAEDSDSNVEVSERFDLVSDEEEIEGRPSGESSSEEEEERPQRRVKPGNKVNAKSGAIKGRVPKFFELAKGEKISNVVGFGNKSDVEAQKNRRRLNKLPLAERLKLEKVKEQERSVMKSMKGGGVMREMTYLPHSARKNRGETNSRDARKKRGIKDLNLKDNSSGRSGKYRR